MQVVSVFRGTLKLAFIGRANPVSDQVSNIQISLCCAMVQYKHEWEQFVFCLTFQRGPGKSAVQCTKYCSNYLH